MASKMPIIAVNPYMQELCMVVEYQGRETSLNISSFIGYLLPDLLLDF